MSLATESGAVILAGTDYPIRAFTLDELQEVVPLIRRYYEVIAAEGQGAAIAVAKDVLSKALRRDDVGTLPATVDDLWQAISEIGRVSGLRALGERLAPAIPTPPVTGTASMPTSLSPGPETGTPSGD